MARFSSFVFSTWIAQVVSATASIRSLEHNRKLSYKSIAGYEPGSKVTDHNALDLDQAHMESLLATDNDMSFGDAKDVYEQGGNSKSYAVLTLKEDLGKAIAKKTQVTGFTESGAAVTGILYKNAAVNQNILEVQYDTSEEQSTWVMCRVGGLQVGDGDGSKETSGCFAENSRVTIGEDTLEYSYKIDEDNKNGRTLQGFSTQVQAKMIDCEPGCPQPYAEMFVDYYGASDYGDKWVTAAFDKGKTSFDKGNGDFSDASVTGYIGRREAIKKGTAYLNVFMYVIREFEDAVIDCKTECDLGKTCNDDPVHAWDEGVAFYTGSLEGEDGEADGKMLHQLADKRCKNFKTCGANGDSSEGTSYVNLELMKLFNQGKDQLRLGECGKTRSTVTDIVDLMFVPLIQGTMRYAYKVGVVKDGEKSKAEGATFAASILPRVHNATSAAAEIIYDNMKIGASSTNFPDVKKALESVYSDFNVKCDHIGGLLTSDGADYFSGAEPCGNSAASISSIAMSMVLPLIAAMFV